MTDGEYRIHDAWERFMAPRWTASDEPEDYDSWFPFSKAMVEKGEKTEHMTALQLDTSRCKIEPDFWVAFSYNLEDSTGQKLPKSFFKSAAMGTTGYASHYTNTKGITIVGEFNGQPIPIAMLICDFLEEEKELFEVFLTAVMKLGYEFDYITCNPSDNFEEVITKVCGPKKCQLCISQFIKGLDHRNRKYGYRDDNAMQSLQKYSWFDKNIVEEATKKRDTEVVPPEDIDRIGRILGGVLRDNPVFHMRVESSENDEYMLQNTQTSEILYQKHLKNIYETVMLEMGHAHIFTYIMETVLTRERIYSTSALFKDCVPRMTNDITSSYFADMVALDLFNVRPASTACAILMLDASIKRYFERIHARLDGTFQVQGRLGSVVESSKDIMISSREQFKRIIIERESRGEIIQNNTCDMDLFICTCGQQRFDPNRWCIHLAKQSLVLILLGFDKVISESEFRDSVPFYRNFLFGGKVKSIKARHMPIKPNLMYSSKLQISSKIPHQGTFVTSGSNHVEDNNDCDSNTNNFQIMYDVRKLRLDFSNFMSTINGLKDFFVEMSQSPEYLSHFIFQHDQSNLTKLVGTAAKVRGIVLEKQRNKEIALDDRSKNSTYNVAPPTNVVGNPKLTAGSNPKAAEPNSKAGGPKDTKFATKPPELIPVTKVSEIPTHSTKKSEDIQPTTKKPIDTSVAMEEPSIKLNFKSAPKKASRVQNSCVTVPRTSNNPDIEPYAQLEPNVTDCMNEGLASAPSSINESDDDLVVLIEPETSITPEEKVKGEHPRMIESAVDITTEKEVKSEHPRVTETGVEVAPKKEVKSEQAPVIKPTVELRPNSILSTAVQEKMLQDIIDLIKSDDCSSDLSDQE